MTDSPRVVAVIPAHLASVRFPRKILFPFHGVPMIEHVRRRAMLAPGLADAIVATCDDEIAAEVRSHGGQVVITANTHRNGTTRVAEAIARINCTHVLLLQGDEPLLLPRHVQAMLDAIAENPAGTAWNATGPIDDEAELDRHSFVKCAVAPDNRVLHCFRRTPGYAPFSAQQRYVRKILGIIGYRRDVLLETASAESTPIETAEFIEQMRLLERGIPLTSVPVAPSLPSVNEPQEADIVLEYVRREPEQAALLERVLQGGRVRE